MKALVHPSKHRHDRGGVVGSCLAKVQTALVRRIMVGGYRGVTCILRIQSSERGMFERSLK